MLISEKPSMKRNWVGIVVLAASLLAILACSTPQKRARAGLDRMEVAYTPDAFVKKALAGDVKTVKLFLQAGMDPNSTDTQGRTALIVATRRGALDVMEVLLKSGARVDARDAGTGATALIWAATIGFDSGASLLLEHGADPNEKETTYGGTALMAAAWKGKTKTVGLLLARGADINEKDKYHRTALILACLHGHTHMVQTLLEQGADATIRATVKGMMPGHGRHNMDGQNAFLAAVARGKTETATVFLNQGADPNDRDNTGKTALMLAAQGNWPDTVKLLLKRGADPDLQDKEGNTALSLAQSYWLTDIAEILKTAGGVAPSLSTNSTGYVQKITITGKITAEESGYYIQGQIPREIYIIHNPNDKTLKALAKSKSTVVIEARIVLGDNVAIETIDGTPYQGDDE